MSSTAALDQFKSKFKKFPSFANILLYFGMGIFGIGLAILLSIFYPVVSEEVNYQVVTKNQKSIIITPVDTQFGIVIPKIGANAKVIANVDPYNEKEYQWQLTKGVAHAKGTVYPGQVGNVFIFAHSAGDFWQANRFNAVFYLLYKLDKGDEIDLFLGGKKFPYQVVEKKYVAATDVSYLSGSSFEKTLTLMTCWPPGTTLKRLVVIAIGKNKGT